MLAPTRELVAELNIRARTDRLAGLDDGSVVHAADQNPSPARWTGRRIRSLRRGHDHHPPQRPQAAHQRHRLGQERRPVDRQRRRHHGRVNGALTVRAHCAPAGTSACPPTTSPHTSSSATPPPSTAPRASPPTPCHTVLTGDEDRQLLYVALTRGRDANHLYLNAAMDGDEHSIITPRRHPPPDRTQPPRADPAPRRGPTVRHHHRPPRRRPRHRADPGHRPLPRQPAHRRRRPARRRPDWPRSRPHAEALRPGDPRLPRLAHPARPPGADRRRRASTPRRRSPQPCTSGRSTPPPTSPPSWTGGWTPPTPAPPHRPAAVAARHPSNPATTTPVGRLPGRAGAAGRPDH